MAAKDHRPLSPHLSVYRWQITNTLSILHRITGFALTGGSLLLVLWIWTAAYFPECFAAMHDFMTSSFGLVLLFGWSSALYYHLANGIRHLLWDTGSGLTMPAVTSSGILVLIFTFMATLGTWGFVLMEGRL